MLVHAFIDGERPGLKRSVGALTAAVGLIYLVLPGLEAPPPMGAGLMAVSGVAWGLYSVHGRGSKDPLAETAGNFMWSVPLALLLLVLFRAETTLPKDGLILAVLSGALTSGLGYAVWYAALRGLSGTQAAMVQLTVPIIAAVGGVVFLSEVLTTRLLFSSALVLGGVAVAVRAQVTET